MNIVKELKELKLNADCIDKLIDEVAIQQSELAKKSHLLKAIGVSTLIEEAVTTNFFKNAEIKNIQIGLGYKYDDDTKDYECRMIFELVDSNNEVISRGKIPANSEQLEKFFHSIFYGMKDINIDFYSEKLKDNNKFYLELKPGIQEKILELLLCQELKKVYDYSNMQLDLEDNDNPIRRLKI